MLCNIFLDEISSETKKHNICDKKVNTFKLYAWVWGDAYTGSTQIILINLESIAGAHSIQQNHK